MPKAKPKLKGRAGSLHRVVRRLDALLRGGQMCSNCCYNVAQNVSTSSDVARSMRESYEAWDAASAAMRKVMPPNAPGERPLADSDARRSQ